jgi:outer membrane lipoprotein SlyB
MKKLVVFAVSAALATGGIASSAGAVGCLSGAVAGGVAGHFVRTGPNHKRHTLAGAAAGCVAGHMLKEHEKKVAREHAAATGQPIHH